jgi:hypothetical protein
MVEADRQSPNGARRPNPEPKLFAVSMPISCLGIRRYRDEVFRDHRRVTAGTGERPRFARSGHWSSSRRGEGFQEMTKSVSTGSRCGSPRRIGAVAFETAHGQRVIA